MKIGLSLFGAAALVITAPAWSQAVGPDTNAPAAKSERDPNEVVCEKQEVVGSRLSSSRVCKTRAEWAEERRGNRMEVERAQTQRGCNNRC